MSDDTKVLSDINFASGNSALSNNKLGSDNQINIALIGSNLEKEKIISGLDDVVQKYLKGLINQKEAKTRFDLYKCFLPMFDWHQRRNLDKLATQLFTDKKNCEQTRSFFEKDEQYKPVSEQINLIVVQLLRDTKTEQMEALLKKSLNQILSGTKISLSTIKALGDMTDDDLKEFKELSRYSNSIGVYKCEMLTEGILYNRFRLNTFFKMTNNSFRWRDDPVPIKTNSDHFFYRNLALEISNANTLFVSFSKAPKDINDKLECRFEFLADLTGCGVELYNLVKDDLSQAPEEYVSSLISELETLHNVKIFLRAEGANIYKNSKLEEELKARLVK